MYSLRRTLAVRFSLTLFAALLFIAFWAYVGAQRVVRRELDKGLAAAAQLESAALAAGLPIPPHPGPSDEHRFVEAVNRFVAVRDSTGAVSTANTPLASVLPLDTASFKRARAGEKVWATQAWRGGRIRSLYAPAPNGSRSDQVIIQVAASLTPLAAANREVQLLMLGTVLLGTLATAVGAAWLASSTLAPVREITTQAEAIGLDTTARRITAHADVVEYEGLVRVLNRMLERLDQALDTQRRIIADVGHDIRTPITVMRGELEVALRSARDPEQYRVVLRSMLEEVDRLGSISEALVLLARLESGALVPQRQSIDLAAVAHAAVARAQRRAGDRQIRLSTDDDLTAELDEQMIRVVIEHLLDNAVRHTPPATTIAVSVAGENGHVRIAVEDDGPGIPAELLPRLFERFYRADAARTRTAGAGLGLTIAAAITKPHSGMIVADKSTFGGLRVTIQLPRALN